MLEYILLGFLMSTEMTGYEIKRRIERCISNFFDASFGSIYPALARLETKKLILSRDTIENGKYKKIYSLTEEGTQYFLEWLNKPTEFTRTKHDHLVKIFFYDHCTLQSAKTNLQDLLSQVESMLKDLKAIEPDTHSDISRHSFFQYSTIEYGIRYYTFIIKWCKDYIKTLEEETK